MAIVSPAKLQVIGWDQLTGRIEAGEEPIKTIAENTNWLYARGHRPALVNCGVGDDFAPQVNAEHHVSFVPSADGLTYEVYLRYYVDSIQNVTYQIETSPDAAAWTFRVNTTIVAPAIGDHARDGTDTFVIAATDRYIRLIMNPAAAGNIQVQSFLIRPAVQTLTTGVKTSGFIAFDNAALPSGGAIHTELLNRIRNNTIRIMRDRFQAVASYVTNLNRVEAIIPASTHGLIALWPYRMVGQPNPSVTLRIWADSPTQVEKIYLQQIGGKKTAAYSVDNVRRTTTLDLQGDQGLLALTLDTTTGTRAQVKYALVDWQPGD